jgi:phospholipase C
MRSPNWKDSAFLWSYDDWGGWYDHVEPPQVDKHGYGFRVPSLLVSAYAKKGYVDSTTLDFTSALKFITHNWGLKSLASRDRKANNFLDAFDFSAPPRDPVFLGLERNPVPPKRIDSVPVYWSYAITAGAVAILVVVAVLSGRRRREA